MTSGGEEFSHRDATDVAGTTEDPGAVHDLDEGLKSETLLPVHGLVRLSKRELEVIDHPAFQRLFEIHQLGQTHLVYRGATHARGEHAIGALEVVTLMARALKRNGAGDQPEALTSDWQLDVGLTPQEVGFARLGALVHDIGHLPAGHTLEDELGLLEAHDSDHRLNLVFRKIVYGHGALRDETAEQRINRLYEVETAQAGVFDASGRALTATEIVYLLVSKDHATATTSQVASRRRGFRLSVLRDLIGNTICADLIDYLHRDWLHIGKPLPLDLRLLDYLEIRSRVDPSTKEEQFKLVVNLGTREKPRADAVTAIVHLLDSRYQLSEIALFHRMKLSAAAMLERCVAEYQDSFGDDIEACAVATTDLEHNLLQCSDPEVYSLLNQVLMARVDEISQASTRSRLLAAAQMAARLRVRQLHKQIAVFWEADLPNANFVRERYAPDRDLRGRESAENKRTMARNRLLALHHLEKTFGLPPCSLVMYCPPRNMNSKIALVNVFRDEAIEPLVDLDNVVAGGHLESQQHRFRRLWRVAFAMERESRDQLVSEQRLGLLIDTITYGVLGEAPHYGTADSKIHEVASQLYGEASIADQALVTAGAFDERLFFPSRHPVPAYYLTDRSRYFAAEEELAPKEDVRARRVRAKEAMAGVQVSTAAKTAADLWWACNYLDDDRPTREEFEWLMHEAAGIGLRGGARITVQWVHERLGERRSSPQAAPEPP